MNTRFSLAILIAALTISSVKAQTCSPNITRTAPDSRYQLVVGSGGSEVLDTQTKLIWYRCSIGQTWNGTTCTGVATSHWWTEALAKAKSVGSLYRLPNIRELQSLVEEACYNSAVNETFFPATLSYAYWSASHHSDQYEMAWSVEFLNGYAHSNFKPDRYYVRAVRAGP